MDLDYINKVKACWDNDIYVVQKPIKYGGIKGSDIELYIDYKGKGKVEGSGTYKQNSIELSEAIITAYKYAYDRFIDK